MERGGKLEQGEGQAPDELPPAKVAQQVGDHISVLNLLVVVLLLLLVLFLHLHLRCHLNHCTVAVTVLGVIIGVLLLLVLLLLLIVISLAPLLSIIIHTVHQRLVETPRGRPDVRVKVTRAKGEELLQFLRHFYED